MKNTLNTFQNGLFNNKYLVVTNLSERFVIDSALGEHKKFLRNVLFDFICFSTFNNDAIALSMLVNLLKHWTLTDKLRILTTNKAKNMYLATKNYWTC